MDIFYLDSWNPVINEKQFDGFTRDTGIESVVRLKVFRYYLDFFFFFNISSYSPYTWTNKLKIFS